MNSCPFRPGQAGIGIRSGNCNPWGPTLATQAGEGAAGQGPGGLYLLPGLLCDLGVAACPFWA